MKRWLVGLGLAVLAAAALLPGHTRATAPQDTKVEDQLIQIERDWLSAEAKGDLATLRRLFADDFIGMAFGGNIVNKEDVIPPEGGGNRIWAKTTLQDPTVRVFGDTAVGLSRVKVDDPQQPGDFRFSMVFQKRGGNWVVVAAHLARN